MERGYLFTPDIQAHIPLHSTWFSHPAFLPRQVRLQPKRKSLVQSQSLPFAGPPQGARVTRERDSLGAKVWVWVWVLWVWVWVHMGRVWMSDGVVTESLLFTW